MCKGERKVEKQDQDKNKCDPSHARRQSISCALCNSKAVLYCQADDAYLCRKCDKFVHGANFLAHRHTRCMLCNTCQNLTRRYLVGAYTKMLQRSRVIGLQGDGRNYNDECTLVDHGSNNYARSLRGPFQFL